MRVIREKTDFNQILKKESGVNWCECKYWVTKSKKASN